MTLLAKASGYITSPVFVDADGESPADTASAPTVTVTRADGTSLAAPTVDDPTTGDGQYRAALTSAVHLTRPDVLTVVWTGTVTGVGEQVYTEYLEVAGGRYVSPRDLRTRPGLEDINAFTPDRLLEALAHVEAIVEEATGVAWVPRYAREEFVGAGQSTLTLGNLYPRSIVAVTVDGTAVTPTTVFELDDRGTLTYTDDVFTSSSDGARNVIVDYLYGLDGPPADLRREVLDYTQTLLLAQEGPLGDNVIGQTFDGINLRYSTPDPSKGRPTGHMKFDAVLQRYASRRAPRVA